MVRKTSLSVNDVPIKLDYFVKGYIEQVVGGIVASLKDTGEIESLELSINHEGQVTINLNGSVVSLKYFPIEIIKRTILGMIAPLKGVEQVDRLQLTIIS